CNTWVHHETIGGKRVPIVLMGDAAHTAHFSIGSGTKLALEDAIDLANEFSAHPREYPTGLPLEAALQQYEARRSVEVLRSRMRRAIPPSGSRTSAATPAWRWSSSRIRC